jgi:predicted ATPase
MYLKTIAIDAGSFPTLVRFPFNLRQFQETGTIELTSPVVFFVGGNGTGKSSLLDAVARRGGFLPWGGTKIHRVHNNPYETQLARYITLRYEQRHEYGFHFRAEAFFNFCSSLDDIMLDDPRREDYFGGRSLNILSHGEAFLSFFRGYSFQLDGLYLMDEPEAALAPDNQLEFTRIIRRAAEKGDKQYIIATHSPIILGCPGAQILSFDDVPVRPIKFTETNHFRLYKDFMENPAGFFPGATNGSGEAQ